METNHEHHSHHKHNEHVQNKEHSHHNAIKIESTTKLALSATLHCLLGCGLGEVIGIIIGTALKLDNMTTMVIAVVLGFIMGLLLGLLPLLKAKFKFVEAIKMILIAEGLSIAVMETAEVLVQLYVPGLMEAGLTTVLFWSGMGFSLLAGFIAAFPVNLYLIGKGVRHQH
jgi:hypothetical protein